MAEPIQLPPLPPAKLEIINLIDVLITLIAFFMLTAVFAEKSHRLNIQLPVARHSGSAAAQSKAAVKKIEIGIDRENRVYYEGQAIQAEELPARLRIQNPETVVVIRADRECRYGWVVKVLDVVKSCRLSKVALEVRQ
jgi:biopolymer transport protein ExbD